MNAVIVLIGPSRYGNAMWELQAEITVGDGTERTLHWSLHNQEQDAIEYRDRFNSHKEKVKKP
jgi:hypothetical protein